MDKTKIYKVLIDDNFHYMDESERYIHGSYDTLDKAIKACRSIVDEFIRANYQSGMKADELSASYALYGEDPYILGADDKVPFSGRDYVAKRAKELCG